MKTIIFKLSFNLVFILLSMRSFAQPPVLCDTCHYGFKPIVTSTATDSIYPFLPKSSSEFQGCDGSGFNVRNITFIHGLGGSARSWAKQVSWTDHNYLVSEINTNYSSDYETDFDDLGKYLNQTIYTGLMSGANDMYPNRCKYGDFAIAHSQGGIAARFLDYQWDVNYIGNYGLRRFYGLVTFGTPHAGADVALSRDQHSEFILNVARSVLLEKAYGKIYDISQMIGTIAGFDAKYIIAKTDTFVRDNLAPAALGHLHTGTLNQMAPGTPFMDSLNKHQSRLRKVAFYGIESAPECWKVMSNFSDYRSEDYPIWGATKDNQFQIKMEKVRAQHEAEIQVNKDQIRLIWEKDRHTLREKLGFIIFGELETKWQKSLRLLEENLYREQAVHFLNNANTYWRYLIGSYHIDSFNTVNTTKYLISWEQKAGSLGSWSAREMTFYDSSEALEYCDKLSMAVGSVRNIQIVPQHHAIKARKFFPSDGVVLVRSQIAFPGVGDRTDKLEGDNHFQERNSPETERVLKTLFRCGSKCYDPYFEIPKK